MNWPNPLVVKSTGSGQRRLAVARRFRVGVDIKRCPPISAVTRPEPATAHLVRVGFGHDPTGHVGGDPAGRWCRAAGKARDREVEAAPEEVDRAYLADKARAEHLQDAVGLRQRLPKPLNHHRIILRMGSVLVERYGIRDFIRHGPDVDLDAETL